MRYLAKLRGTKYALRVKAPDLLVGMISVWIGEPFRKTITFGLGTRVHAEAVRFADVRLDQLRQLEAEAGGGFGTKSVGRMINLSSENAREWREMRAEEVGDELDHILTNQLEDAARAGLERRSETLCRGRTGWKSATGRGIGTVL